MVGAAPEDVRCGIGVCSPSTSTDPQTAGGQATILQISQTRTRGGCPDPDPRGPRFELPPPCVQEPVYVLETLSFFEPLGLWSEIQSHKKVSSPKALCLGQQCPKSLFVLSVLFVGFFCSWGWWVPNSGGDPRTLMASAWMRSPPPPPAGYLGECWGGGVGQGGSSVGALLVTLKDAQKVRRMQASTYGSSMPQHAAVLVFEVL